MYVSEACLLVSATGEREVGDVADERRIETQRPCRDADVPIWLYLIIVKSGGLFEMLINQPTWSYESSLHMHHARLSTLFAVLRSTGTSAEM